MFWKNEFWKNGNSHRAGRRVRTRDKFDEDEMAALEDAVNAVNAVSQRGQRDKRGQSTR